MGWGRSNNDEYEKIKKSDEPTVSRWNNQSEKTIDAKYEKASAADKAAFDKAFKDSK